jgi:hypothetical protein
MTAKINTVVSQETTAKAKINAFIDFYKNPITTYISGGCPILIQQ